MPVQKPKKSLPAKSLESVQLLKQGLVSLYSQIQHLSDEDRNSDRMVSGFKELERLKAKLVKVGGGYEVIKDLEKEFSAINSTVKDLETKFSAINSTESEMTSKKKEIKRGMVLLRNKLQHISDEDGNSDEVVIGLKELELLKVQSAQVEGGHEVMKDLEKEFSAINSTESEMMSKESANEEGKCTTKEKLTEELFLDPNPRVSVKIITEFYKVNELRSKESFEMIFWTGLEEDLQLSPPCYDRILRILIEIRDSIIEVGDGIHRLQAEEVVNVDLLQTKIREKSFDWRELICGIFQIVEKLEYTHCTTQTASMWEETKKAMASMWEERKKAMDVDSDAIESQNAVFCKALEFFLMQINILRLDRINGYMQTIASIVHDEGIECGESGVVTTKNTRAWLKHSISSLFKDHTILVGYIAEGNAAAIARAHGSAIVDLIENKTLCVPETLQWDVQKIEIMRNQYARFVVYCVVLVTVRDCLGKLKATAEAELVGKLVAVEIEDDWKDRCMWIGGTMMESDCREGFMNLIKKRLGNPMDPVHALIRTRVRAFWEKAVNGPRSGTEKLCGVGCLETIAKEWTAKLALVAYLDLGIYRFLYDDLMPSVAIEVQMQQL